jgi:hypothetical protein
LAESEFTIDAPVGFLQDGTPAANLPDDVKIVQFLLNTIPASEGAPDFLLDVDGIYGTQTNTAVGGFQQHQFGFVDHLVEPGLNTITQMSVLALAQLVAAAPLITGGEELRSWAVRPLAQWNFTRGQLAMASQAGGLTFSADAQALLPPLYQTNLLTAIATILNPNSIDPGSWGISPFDFFHFHVLIKRSTATAEDDAIADRRRVLDDRMEALRRQAAGGTTPSAKIATPDQARQYKQLLRTLVPEYRKLLEDLARRPGVRIDYHSFEIDKWRPKGMQSDDQRRYWRSLTLNANPVVEPSEFRKTKDLLDANLDGCGVAFLVDQQRVIHAVPGSLLQLSAITELPEDAFNA